MDSFILNIILMLLSGYLIGSINPAYIIGKVFKGLDIREYGSKNAGTMNAFLVLGKTAGIITLLYDISKGILSILVASLFTPYGLKAITQFPLHKFYPFIFLAGIFSILGHVSPFYLKFKGGKGAATTYGIVAFLLIILMVKGIFPWVIFLLFALFVASFIIITKSANLACFIFNPILIFLINYFGYKEATFLSLFSSILLLFLILISFLQVRKKGWMNEIKYAPEASKVKLVRKILRVWAVLFPLIYIIFAQVPTLIFIGFWGVVFIICEIFRFKSKNFRENKIVNVLLRKREEKSLSGITLFTISSFLVVLLFIEEIAIMALFFAIFGDLLAELIGKKFGRIKVIGGKTLEGTAMCFCSCLALGLILKIPYNFSYPTIVTGSLAAAFIELVPIKIDDNFTMPLFVSIILWLII